VLTTTTLSFQVWDLGGNGCINSVKPSAGPSAAIGSSGKDTASVSSAKLQRAVRYADQQGVVPIQTVDISEDSRTLVAISNHGMVFVWDPSRGGLGGQAHAHHNPGGGHRNSPNHQNIGNDEVDDVVVVTDPRDYPSTMDTAPNTPATEEEDMSAAAIDANGQSSLLKTITKFRAHAPGFYCLHGKISPGRSDGVENACVAAKKDHLLMLVFCFVVDFHRADRSSRRLSTAGNDRKRRDGQAVGHDDVGAHRHAPERHVGLGCRVLRRQQLPCYGEQRQVGPPLELEEGGVLDRSEVPRPPVRRDVRGTERFKRMRRHEPLERNTPIPNRSLVGRVHKVEKLLSSLLLGNVVVCLVYVQFDFLSRNDTAASFLFPGRLLAPLLAPSVVFATAAVRIRGI
jgi:hypothetical protein